MRAVFNQDLELEDVTPGSLLEVSGDEFLHLVQVTRAQVGEEVIILNGFGLKAISNVESISKKSVTLKIHSAEVVPPRETFDLAVGLVKKEALERVLVLCAELGVQNLYLLNTQYSQRETLQEKRFQSILTAACKQSNNPYLPRVMGPLKLTDLELAPYQSIFFLSARPMPKEVLQVRGKALMIIGPEGGFSETEEAWAQEQPEVEFLYFQAPILRTPTALAVAAGFYFTQVQT